MNVKRMAGVAVLALAMLTSHAGLVWAGKSDATIQAPDVAKKGEDVTIQVTFSHSSNSGSHHTQWAKVSINGKEVARWDFSEQKLPEGARFSREVKVKADQELNVLAEASCNKHGSAGPARAKIAVK
jgi:desulfoferrodoxin (superoxide reductase-like protein)